MIDLETLSEAALTLDPLPASAVRLATLATERDPDLGAICEVIGFDQPLTVALLRAANSSWSAPREPIATVREAVIRLGDGQVLTLALAGPLRSRTAGAIPEYRLAEGQLWRHSLAASLAAETLMSFTSVPLPAETPTAALLHDVGKLVISRFVKGEDLHALDIARDEHVVEASAEREILGVDHAELGALIAQAWALPECLTAGIAHHHSPADVDLPIAYGVHLADAIAKFFDTAPDSNADVEIFSRSMGELGLTANALDRVTEIVGVRLAEVTARYS